MFRDFRVETFLINLSRSVFGTQNQKKLIKLKKIMFSVFALSLFTVSCKKDVKEISQTNVTDIEASMVSQNDFLESSVAILHDGAIQTSDGSYALKAQLTSFDPGYSMLPVYKFDGVEYCDNGLFNDEIEGDGIYTSVKTANLNNQQLDIIQSEIIVNKGSNFQYESDLDIMLNDILVARAGIEITFGCSVRLVPCPNTSWYNTSLFGEPCIEFYDCEASVSVSL